MSSFQSVNPLWDFNLPADSLTSLPDDDFLAILQSQIANPNGFQDPSTFFLPNQSHRDIPLSANPKTLTRLPDPSNTESPLTDSSPSPPSGQEGSSGDTSQNRRDSVHTRRGHSTEDALKRKASQDDDEDDPDGAPPTNKSHTTGQTKSSKRRSGANVSADELRLLKRKEQNRAAQRAFRERKEKHVKDLEDQLAVAEAKNDTTQSENDNLKEMLRRLQAENTLLKQAAFTFSVPRVPEAKATTTTPPSSKGDTPAGGSTTQSEAQQYISKVAQKETSGSVTSSQPSPNSLFEDSFGDIYTTPSSVSTDSPKALSDKLGTNDQGQTFDWMPGVNQQPSSNGPFQSPFTIISSNPTYMSYRDPSPSSNSIYAFNSMSSSYSQPLASPTSAGSSFYPQQAQQAFLSPDITMKDYSTPSSQHEGGHFSFSPSTDMSSLDDLFGGQMNPSESLSPYSIGTSPISHSAPSAKSSPPTPSSSKEPGNCGSCSKEQLADFIAASGQSSFVSNESRRLVYENGRISFDGKPLEPTQMDETNLDASTAFQTLQEHPKFKECDISGLCADFAAKAKCDGVRAVIPPTSMQELMDSYGIKGQVN